MAQTLDAAESACTSRPAQARKPALQNPAEAWVPICRSEAQAKVTMSRPVPARAIV